MYLFIYLFIYLFVNLLFIYLFMYLFIFNSQYASGGRHITVYHPSKHLKKSNAACFIRL